jgi:hypothetical protein
MQDGLAAGPVEIHPVTSRLQVQITTEPAYWVREMLMSEVFEESTRVGIMVQSDWLHDRQIKKNFIIYCTLHEMLRLPNQGG